MEFLVVKLGEQLNAIFAKITSCVLGCLFNSVQITPNVDSQLSFFKRDGIIWRTRETEHLS